MDPRTPLRTPAWLRRAGTVALVTVVVALAMLQVRGWDGTVNADGVSYLDLATLYASGHAGALANGYWSPLYPLLLGLALRAAAMFGMSATEMQVVFAVNMIIFAMATLALVHMSRSLSATHASRGSMSVVVLRSLAAGALSIWCLLRMINASAVTPDALLATWLFLASADIADAAAGGERAHRDWRFGVVLGLGYWTKAVFFPVAITAMIAYVIASPARSRRLVTMRALVPLFLIAAPLVALQSWTQGRPSFGETGRLNYRWYVGGAEHATPILEAVSDTRARELHGDAAPVALASAPGAVLFTGGTVGSFPYWLDASRYEPRDGMRVSFDAQRRMLFFNAHWFRVTAGAFILFVAVGTLASSFRATVRPIRLLSAVPAVTMLALYALTHPEGRLGAGAVACVILVLVHLADVAPSGWRRPLIVVECVALGILSILAVGRTLKRIPDGQVAVAPTPSVASLRAAGIPAGSAIGIVGSPFGQLWAHQGDVRIVAVIPPTDSVHVVNDSLLRAVTSEASARGVSLRAIVWRGDAVSSRDALPLAPNWSAVRLSP